MGRGKEVIKYALLTISDATVIGYFVVALSALIALFTAIYKPLNDNTKAMTELSVKMQRLTEELEKQNKDFEDYKKHVSESQKRQWDAINEQDKRINETQHELEMCKQENGRR